METATSITSHTPGILGYRGSSHTKCFPISEFEGGFVPSIHCRQKKKADGDPGRVMWKEHFFLSGMMQSHLCRMDKEYVASWRLRGSLEDHPTHEYSMLPARHTLRGRSILKHMLLDLEDMINGRPIAYLALYSKDLLSTEKV